MEYKAVFHIDEAHKWRLLLGNVRNLLEAFDGGTIRVDVVANSEAVNNYRKHQFIDDDARMMADLSDRGVQFVACNNALVGQGISKKELVDFVEVVPSGVLELVVKQHAGYAYLKP